MCCRFKPRLGSAAADTPRSPPSQQTRPAAWRTARSARNAGRIAPGSGSRARRQGGGRGSGRQPRRFARMPDTGSAARAGAPRLRPEWSDKRITHGHPAHSRSTGLRSGRRDAPHGRARRAPLRRRGGACTGGPLSGRRFQAEVTSCGIVEAPRLGFGRGGVLLFGRGLIIHKNYSLNTHRQGIIRMRTRNVPQIDAG